MKLLSVLALLAALFACGGGGRTTAIATSGDTFATVTVASGLAAPTSMALAPDGRVFIGQQGGAVRIVKGDVLLATPFVTLTVDSTGERGLIGIALDPAFAVNGFVYLHYTTPSPAVHNRISRFTAAGDLAVPGSELVLLDLDNLSLATNHNGGALHFGPDGRLYAGVGENANPSDAQLLTNLMGKLLRMNPDGTTPADNPLLGQTLGNRQLIYAYGLRNPFTFAFQPGSGRLFINDVGQSAWEEIDLGRAGANYGWPLSEGVTGNPAFDSPRFAYPHLGGPVTGCAITGGDFYGPVTPSFPATFVGKYLFMDFCGGWIRTLDPVTGAVADWLTGFGNPVDLRVAPDGTVLVLAGAGTLQRISFVPPG